MFAQADQVSRLEDKLETIDAIAALVDKVTQLEQREEDCRERTVAYSDKIKELQTAKKTQQRAANDKFKSSGSIENRLNSLTKKLEDAVRCYCRVGCVILFGLEQARGDCKSCVFSSATGFKRGTSFVKGGAERY